MGKSGRQTEISEDGELTPQMEEFCRQFIVDLNATKAAERARYSAKTAGSQASRLLKNVKIQDQIKRLMNERSERTQITADLVLERILELATVDLADAYDEKGNLKHIHDIPQSTRRAIAGIEVFEEFDGFGQERHKIGETRKVRFNDKNRALEMLGRHLKLFTDKVEVDVVDHAEILRKARERSKSRS